MSSFSVLVINFVVVFSSLMTFKLFGTPLCLFLKNTSLFLRYCTGHLYFKSQFRMLSSHGDFLFFNLFSRSATLLFSCFRSPNKDRKQSLDVSFLMCVFLIILSVLFVVFCSIFSVEIVYPSDQRALAVLAFYFSNKGFESFCKDVCLLCLLSSSSSQHCRKVSFLSSMNKQILFLNI